MHIYLLHIAQYWGWTINGQMSYSWYFCRTVVVIEQPIKQCKDEQSVLLINTCCLCRMLAARHVRGLPSANALQGQIEQHKVPTRSSSAST